MVEPRKHGKLGTFPETCFEKILNLARWHVVIDSFEFNPDALHNSSRGPMSLSQKCESQLRSALGMHYLSCNWGLSIEFARPTCDNQKNGNL